MKSYSLFVFLSLFGMFTQATRHRPKFTVTVTTATTPAAVPTDLPQEAGIAEPPAEQQDVGVEARPGVPARVPPHRQRQVPRVVAEAEQAAPAGPHLGQPRGRRGQRVRRTAGGGKKGPRTKLSIRQRHTLHLYKVTSMKKFSQKKHFDKSLTS